MKKIIICIALLCSLVLCVSCGNSNNSASPSQTAAQKNETEESAEESLDDFISEVSKENYSKIPDEAMDAFNFVSKNAKKIFTEVDGKWMYGFKGSEVISGEDCYIFVVYTENEESGSKVGMIAKAKNSDNLYKHDDTTGKFDKVALSNDSDNSWAKTPTKFKDK